MRAWVVIVAICVAACGRLGFANDRAGVDASADAVAPGGACMTDTDCAGSTYCDLDVAPSVCACVSGYSDLGAGCAWTGVIANPGFGATGGWTDPTGAIDPAFVDSMAVDPGAALIRAGGITQIVTMPRRSRAEPLMLTLLFRDTGGSGDAPTVGLGGMWIEDDAFGSSWQALTTCLGPEQFAPETSTGSGTPLTLELGSRFATAVTLDLDRVDIAPATVTCPEDAQVLDGDLEGDASDWTFGVPDGSATGSHAGIVAGVGVGGSHAVELDVTQQCGEVNASTQFAAPALVEDRPSALSYYMAPPSSGILRFSASGVYLPIPTTSGVVQSCIAAPLRGQVSTLTIDLSILSGCVSAAPDTTVIADNIAIVDDPACGNDPYIADPGFESAGAVMGVYTTGSGIVTHVFGNATAHSGSGAVELSATVRCDLAEYTASVITPPPDANGGPALAYYYKAAAANVFPLQVGSTALVQDGTWHRGIACLDPTTVGRGQAVYFELSTSGNGSCGTPTSTSTGYLDDLSATTDPSCPSS